MSWLQEASSPKHSHAPMKKKNPPPLLSTLDYDQLNFVISIQLHSCEKNFTQGVNLPAAVIEFHKSTSQPLYEIGSPFAFYPLVPIPELLNHCFRLAKGLMYGSDQRQFMLEDSILDHWFVVRKKKKNRPQVPPPYRRQSLSIMNLRFHTIQTATTHRILINHIRILINQEMPPPFCQETELYVSKFTPNLPHFDWQTCS